MSMQRDRSGGTEPRASQMFLLQVGYRGDGSVAGMLRIYDCEKAVRFTGIDQAILMINEWLNREGSQSGAVELRTFDQDGPSYLDRADAAGTKAADAAPGLQYQNINERRTESFLIHVICRQNTSWQGEVRWNGQRSYFRSGLELISLIRSGLDRSAMRVPVRFSATRKRQEASGKALSGQLAAG